MRLEMNEILSSLKDWIIKALEDSNTDPLIKNIGKCSISAAIEKEHRVFKIRYEDKQTRRSTTICASFEEIADAINYGDDKYYDEQKFGKLIDQLEDAFKKGGEYKLMPIGNVDFNIVLVEEKDQM